MASTVPVVDDIKRKSSASLLLDYALNAMYHLCCSPAWVASKIQINADAQQRLLDIAAGNPSFHSVFLADRVASCLDPLRPLNHPDGSSSFRFDALPGSAALGGVADGVGGFFSDVFAKTKSGLSSVGDATGISKAVGAAASGLDKAKSSVVGAVNPTPAHAPATAAEGESSSSNPFVRAFDAVKSGVTAIGDKVVDVAKAGADVAKSGVSAAADATSAGLNKAVGAAKAGSDAAMSGMSAATAAAASVVPSSGQPQQGSDSFASAAPTRPPIVSDVANGPSVKELAGKFAVTAHLETHNPRGQSFERPPAFAYQKENTRPHASPVIEVPASDSSEVFHC